MGKIQYNAEQVASVFKANPKEESIVITSDGNVFLTKHKSYAKNHCNEFKQEFEVLTRAEFEAGQKGGKSNAPAASGTGDWKTGKFKDIVEFAKSKGLEATTKSNKGTAALIEEVEAFLATLEPDTKEGDDTDTEDSKESKEGDSDYTPVGSGFETPAE